MLGPSADHCPRQAPATMPQARTGAGRMGHVEFILFLSACLAIGAMATDLFVPALHTIGLALAPGAPSTGQATIAAFLVGLGAVQPLAGPVADHWGRRPLTLAGIIVFALGAMLAAQAGNVPMIIAARLMQGLGAGALRVALLSQLRDRYDRTKMSQVTSIAFAFVLLEPVFGPLIGREILVAGGWRMIPTLLAALAGVLLVWAIARQTESAAPPTRARFELRNQVQAYRLILSAERALASMAAYALMLGAHVGFLSCAEQVFLDAFGQSARFPTLLATVSAALALGAWTNASLGRHCTLHGRAIGAMGALLVANAAALLAALSGGIDLNGFMVIQGANLFAFGMLAPNLTAISLSEFADAIGKASAVFGCVTTVPAALIGYVVGQSVEGHVVTLFAAYLLLTALALGVFVHGFRTSSERDRGRQ